jgi:hypothetical protein
MKAVQEFLRLLVQPPCTLMWGPCDCWVEFCGLSGSCCCFSLSLLVLLLGINSYSVWKTVHCAVFWHVTSNGKSGIVLDCFMASVWEAAQRRWLELWWEHDSFHDRDDPSVHTPLSSRSFSQKTKPQWFHSHPTLLISMQQAFSMFLELKYSVQ